MKNIIWLIFIVFLALITVSPSFSKDNTTLQDNLKTRISTFKSPDKKVVPKADTKNISTELKESDKDQNYKSQNSDDKKSDEAPQTIDTTPIWVTAIATLILAFVALFQEGLKKWWTRPKLLAEFEKKGPWVHDLYLKKNGQTNLIRNYRLKVINNGRRSANRTEARIEKIVLNGKTNWFHPTALKWSGENNWNQVTIPPESHFFLDLFHINNINVPNSPWTLWVDSPTERGLQESYPSKGRYEIHLFVTEETTKPKKCMIKLNWEGHPTNMPDVVVEWEKTKLPESKYENTLIKTNTQSTTSSTQLVETTTTSIPTSGSNDVCASSFPKNK